jgi:DNA-directed RNA polymerase specialized sigma subunit
MLDEQKIKKRYRAAIKVINKVIKHKNIKSIKAEEVVNTAYIALASTGKDIKYLTNKSKFVLIDIIRSECGRSGSKRSEANKNIVSISDFDLLASKTYHDNKLNEDETNFLRLEYQLSENEIKILSMRNLNMTLKDISKVIGLSESRICQISHSLADRVIKLRKANK